MLGSYKKGKYKYQEWLTPDGLLKIEGWARDGLTDEQIAQNMGIAYSTFRGWRDKFSAISAVLKKGKEVIDRQAQGSRNPLLQKYRDFYTSQPPPLQAGNFRCIFCRGDYVLSLFRVSEMSGKNSSNPFEDRKLIHEKKRYFTRD